MLPLYLCIIYTCAYLNGDLNTPRPSPPTYNIHTGEAIQSVSTFITDKCHLITVGQLEKVLNTHNNLDLQFCK